MYPSLPLAATGMSDIPIERVEPDRVRVGVSACLLGDAVRYDGGHKHDMHVSDDLGRRFELVPFCPEVAIGMGVPRPAIRLTGDAAAPRALGADDPALDVTAPLTAYGERVGASIDGLSGYVFKKGSPSCGLRGVPVYAGDGRDTASGAGTGLYAAAIRRLRPLLPVEEEDRLADPALRERFVLRVQVYHRWQCLRAAGVTTGALAGFHAAHEHLLPPREHERHRRMDRLVAASGAHDPEALADQYGAELMAALE